jgi:Lrp/AsnC family leucine-responsive transcriptional regulator
LDLDLTDTKILDALMEDGRASLRKIAQRTALTTPTVSSRLARMEKSGLIRKFVPLLSTDLERGVLAILTIRVGAGSPEKVARALAKSREVQEIYMTTGQSITMKLALDSVKGLQDFVEENLQGMDGMDVVSSQIVTEVVKEEPTPPYRGPLKMTLKCDYCQGEVTSARPYTTSVGSSHYYFCCRTCKGEYLEKHGARLAKLSLKNKALHS